MSAELDPSGQEQGLLAQGHPPIGHAHSAFILAFANVAEVGRRASVESYAHANVAEVGRPASIESYPLANPCKILYGWMSEEAESCWMSEAANLASRKPCKILSGWMSEEAESGWMSDDERILLHQPPLHQPLGKKRSSRQ